MAKKPTITTIASGYYSRNALNTNFTSLRDQFDNTLSLDGSTPNAMLADLDMNSNDILNVQDLSVQGLRIDGVLVGPSDIVAAGANLHSDNYTGNGTTTTYAMTYNPFTKDNTQVYIDGVYQNKATYSINGLNLTFSEAPPLNSAIEIMVARSLDTLAGTDASNVTYTQSGTATQTTVQAKLQEFVSVKDFGAVGDGVTNDTAAIQAAIDSVSSGGNLKFIEGETYLVDQLDFTNIDNLTVSANGATFRISNNLSSTSVGLLFVNCDNLKFDILKCTNSGGYETGRSRLVRLDNCTNVYGDAIDISYDSQHLPVDDNAGSALWQLADNSRAIVVQRSTDVHIKSLKTSKADIAIRLLENRFMTVDYIHIDSYMKGVRIDGGHDITLRGGTIENMTPTFDDHLRVIYDDWRKDRAGNNAILVGDEDAVTYNNMHNFTISDFYISDSGEHGIRIAGADNDRKRFRISNITTKNTGAMGVKILGSDTTYLRDSQIDNLTIIDCLVNEQETLASADGATQFVFDNAAGTITISGINWPEYWGTEITSVTISGSASNNNTYTIDSRDSDTVISVSGATVTDETDSTPSSTFTWTNEGKISHGLALYNVRDCQVSNVFVGEDDETDSCEDGVQLHDAVSVTLTNVHIVNAKEAGISFRPNNGGTNNDIQSIHVSGFVINSCATGVYWNHNNITLNEITFLGGRIQNCTTAFNISDSGGSPGTLAADCVFEAHLENATTYYTADLGGCLLRLFGDTDATKSTTARNGSIWQVQNDTMYILKAGTWTAL